MRSYLVMGLFAFFVTVVSLVRCLREEEFFRLTAMKRVWGRRRGLLMHFLANVALPLVLGIVFFSQGLVAPTTGRQELRQVRAAPTSRIRPELTAVASLPSGLGLEGPWLPVP